MGILQLRPELEAGETVRWKAYANRVVSPVRALGGRLFLTDRRLLFQPNRFDAATGPWSCPLAEVTGVTTVGRDAGIFSGGLRKRLGVETASGEQVFVVNHLRGKRAELERLLAEAGR